MFEPIHIIGPIGATFLRQKPTQMKASSKRPRVDPTTAVDPPPSSSSDASLRSMLDTVMTVQAAHG